MNIPPHLLTSIESADCPPNLTTFEKMAWAAEQRNRNADSDTAPVVQPRMVKTADGLIETS